VIELVKRRGIGIIIEVEDEVIIIGRIRMHFKVQVKR
jgi:hypothetical protein